MWAILPIRERWCQDINQVMRSFFFWLSVFSHSEVLGKITSIRSKLPTWACWSWEEKSNLVPRGSLLCLPWSFQRPREAEKRDPGNEVEKREEPALACSMLKATSVPQTPQTNHSQYSSPVEALNLIVDSKSQPVELDNSTIELHVPSRQKKRLQPYCSEDFDFLALMGFDMTFDVMLRDDSSFGKLTNSCN